MLSTMLQGTPLLDRIRGRGRGELRIGNDGSVLARKGLRIRGPNPFYDPSHPDWNIQLTGDDRRSELNTLLADITAGGKVFIPPGTIGAWRILPLNDTTIEGAGRDISIIKVIPATLFSSAAGIVNTTDMNTFLSRARVTIRDLTLHGNRANIQDHSLSADGSCMGMYLSGWTDCLFERIRFTEWATDAVSIRRETGTNNPCERLTFDGCIFEKCRRLGASFIAGKKIKFIKCIFQNNGFASGASPGKGPQSGFDFEPDNGPNVIEDIVFDGCDFIDNAGHGLMAYEGATGADRPNMRLTILPNCRFIGNAVWGVKLYGPTFYHARQQVGGMFENNGHTPGTDPEYGAIFLENNRRTVVEGADIHVIGTQTAIHMNGGNRGVSLSAIIHQEDTSTGVRISATDQYTNLVDVVHAREDLTGTTVLDSSATTMYKGRFFRERSFTGVSVGAGAIVQHSFSMDGLNVQDEITATPQTTLETGLVARPPYLSGGLVYLEVYNPTASPITMATRLWNVYGTPKNTFFTGE